MFDRSGKYQNQISYLLKLSPVSQNEAIQKLDTRILIDIWNILFQQLQKVRQLTYGLKMDIQRTINAAFEDNVTDINKLPMSFKDLPQELQSEFVNKFNNWQAMNAKEQNLTNLLMQMLPIYEEKKIDYELAQEKRAAYEHGIICVQNR